MTMRTLYEKYSFVREMLIVENEKGEKTVSR